VSITIERPANVVRDDGTRREFVVGGLSLGALLLAGCGSDEPTDRLGGDGFPLTIEHKHGRTRLAGPPWRVVTVGFNEQDFVLALGVKRVGVREWLGEQPRCDVALGPGRAWRRTPEGDAQRRASVRADRRTAPSSRDPRIRVPKHTGKLG
jgi:hypothetical protein